MNKVGRNDPCPCGSGRKFKYCCGARKIPGAGVASTISSLEIAAIHYRAGRLQPAREMLEEALRANPRNPQALHLLGLIAYRSGKRREAVAWLRRAVRVAPSNADYRNHLGVAHMATGNKDEAVASWRLALKIDPAHAEACNNLGNALVDQGELDDALAFLRQALALRPDYAPAHVNMGNALGKQGKAREAIASYQRAIAIEPRNPYVHCNLAKTLSDFGKMEEAAAGYRTALELDPRLAEAHNGLGVTLLEMGRMDEAIQSIRSALALRPDYPEAYFNLHSLLLDSREPAEAIGCLKKLLELKPDDTLARFHLGMLLDYSGDAAAAAEHLQRAATGSPAAQAGVESYRYVKSASNHRALLVGCPVQGFRIGMEAAVAEGLVLEFGVRFGVSIRQIAAIAAQEVHGFDSFEGLPEAWHDEPRGSYSTMSELPVVPKNVTLHKGWFEDTLPAFLEAHRDPVRFLHVDCDIYSSTHTVLELLADRLGPGTVVAFDEYFGHKHWREDEFRAFQEAVARHRWRYEYLSFSSKQAVIQIR